MAAASVLTLNDVEREELLLLAGYANTEEVLATLIQHLEQPDVRRREMERSRGHMLEILHACRQALMRRQDGLSSTQPELRPK